MEHLLSEMHCLIDSSTVTRTFDMDDIVTLLHSTYAGTNSYGGPFDHGQMSMMRQQVRASELECGNDPEGSGRQAQELSCLAQTLA